MIDVERVQQSANAKRSINQLRWSARGDSAHLLTRASPGARLSDGAMALVALCTVLALSTTLNGYGLNWPYGIGFHYDEPKKVHFVLHKTQDFHHPLLMLQLVRLICAATHTTNPLTVVFIGRGLSCACGIGSVAATYALARQVCTPVSSLLACLWVAIVPIMVCHSHYFKEDALHTMCVTLSLCALCILLRNHSVANAIMLGLASGFALSSKYPSILLFVLYACALFCVHWSTKRGYVRAIVISTLVSVGVVVLANWQMLCDVRGTCAGITHELSHMARGHVVKYHAYTFGGAFHFAYSIIPGVTMPLAVLCLLGICRWVWHWRSCAPAERLMCIAAIGYYLVMEASPCKPDPDYMRYMMPLTPVLSIAAARLWDTVRVLMGAGGVRVLAIVILAVVTGTPLWASVQYDLSLMRDTRIVAWEWLAAHEGRVLYERLSGPREDVVSLTDMDPTDASHVHVKYFVASSFMYERFRRGARMGYQARSVYETASRYNKLFGDYPYIEIKPRWRSFGFNNPTIRIVRLDSAPQRAPPNESTCADP